MYGKQLPVTAMARQVFLLRHEDVNLESSPFFIDYPQDIYFRHIERDRRPLTLVSWSDPNEPRQIDFAHRGETYYREHVQPRLVKRIARLADAELANGWAGHYELTPDKSAIVGPVPGREGLFNLNGLSAHGVMQSRALGYAMATLLKTGKWPVDMNLDELNESRFGDKLQRSEQMYV
jgi:sarcosine oxidase subunit beta